MDDIDIPEVLSYQQKPRFYQDNGRQYVEISSVGLKDTIIHKVTPELMAQFREEWNAYCDGRPLEPRAGTPLTVLKEIGQEFADDLQRRNLHNLEELSVLNDHQCQGLGHGLMTLRKKARAIIAQRRFEEETKVKDKINTETAKAPSAPETSGEVAELRGMIEEQGKQLAALIAALTPKQKTPAKKVKNGANIGSGNSNADV